ncbi:sulfurtransferase [Serpentinicella alkaliphila]|uniref:thiosulfate sulfurtransferase n=1 Tax=Serpentinicella alkaliphila TaxID=1734049 RepID=A0A4R2TY50_9FIRM|nr:sulfurtransferase [Serpentinicella alkaliphila]QUH24602.1 sulfurtransferase [Serpentinicella alkaliphila]TCQ02599.1 thiosulfate/3-mercaptopyruvate sulfurtransferase [Serpentinicella alkaliphila]
MFKPKLMLVFILAITLIFSVVGCSNQTTTKSDSEPAQASENGYSNPGSLVSAEELKDLIDDGKVKVLDARDGKNKLLGGFIPTAIDIDRNATSVEVNGVKGMLPNKENFEELMGSLGITEKDTIVVYDEANNLWASRIWWALKVYGHKDVKLLNGGRDAWKAAGYETGKAAEVATSTYKAKEANENLFATLDSVKESFNNKNLLVLDTRSEDEWKEGRIPGAVWIEWTNTINQDGTFKSVDDLKTIYEEKGVTSDKEAIMPYCKSAVRAAHTLFVLQELLGYDSIKNYDGSWLEYSVSGEQIEK